MSYGGKGANGWGDGQYGRGERKRSAADFESSSITQDSRKSSRTRPPLAPGRASRSQEQDLAQQPSERGRKGLPALEIPQSRTPKQVDETEAFEGGDDDEEDHDDKNRERGCRCSRTKCLKQYCQCFRNDIRCCAECVCVDCHNDGKHEEKRIDAIRHIRMNNPGAFKGTALELDEQEVTTPRGSVRHVRGCRCKRSRCQKKYCECFGAGLRCTVNCVCTNCENGNDAEALQDDEQIKQKSQNEEEAEPPKPAPKPKTTKVKAQPGWTQRGGSRRRKEEEEEEEGEEGEEQEQEESQEEAAAAAEEEEYGGRATRARAKGGKGGKGLVAGLVGSSSREEEEEGAGGGGRGARGRGIRVEVPVPSLRLQREESGERLLQEEESFGPLSREQSLNLPYTPTEAGGRSFPLQARNGWGDDSKEAGSTLLQREDSLGLSMLKREDSLGAPFAPSPRARRTASSTDSPDSLKNPPTPLRRSARNASSIFSSLGAAPVSPMVSDNPWLDPASDPEGILAEATSSRGWVKHISDQR